MRRPNFGQKLHLESLESREVMSSGGPTAEAQYMLEMVNLARTNPKAAAEKYTNNLDADVTATLKYYNVDPKQVYNELSGASVRPPLAWNDQLYRAANGMANDQSVNGFQSHTGSNGSDLNQRLDDQTINYKNRVADGENSYAYSKSVDHAMNAFLIDWGVSDHGHRNNILQPNASPDQYYREVGIGIVKAQNPKVGPYVITQDFGTQAGSKAQLVGVAYNDKNGNGTYDMGEGQGNVEVDVTDSKGNTVSAMTWDAGGGYQIPLDPGQYSVRAKFNGSVLESLPITVGTQNVKIDYNLSVLGKGNSSPAFAPASAPASAPAAGVADTNGTFDKSWSSWTL